MGLADMLCGEGGDQAVSKVGTKPLYVCEKCLRRDSDEILEKNYHAPADCTCERCGVKCGIKDFPAYRLVRHW